MDVIDEVVGCLAEDEGLTVSRERIAEYGAYINWLSPHISIESALGSCVVDDDCWASLLLWLANPDSPKAGCSKR